MAIPASRKRKPNRTVFHGYDPSIALVPGDPRLSPPPSWFGVSYHPSQPVSNSWLEWAGDRTAMFDISKNKIVSVSEYSQIATEEKSKRHRQDTKAQAIMPVPFPFFDIMWHAAQPMPNEWHDWGDSPPPSRKGSPDNNNNNNASRQHQHQNGSKQQQQQQLHNTPANHNTQTHSNTANIHANHNAPDDDLAAQSAKLQQLLQAAGTPPPPPGMMQAFQQMQEAINAAAAAGSGVGNVNRSVAGLAPAPPASIAPAEISPVLAVARSRSKPQQQKQPKPPPQKAQQQQQRKQAGPTISETLPTVTSSSSALKALVPVTRVQKSDVSSSMRLLLKEQEDKRLAASARTRQQAQVNRARKQKYLNVVEDYLTHLGELTAAVTVDHATATHANYFSLLDEERGRGITQQQKQQQQFGTMNQSHHHHSHNSSTTPPLPNSKLQIVREQMRALQIAVLSGNSTFNPASHVHCQHNGEAVAIVQAVAEGNYSQRQGLSSSSSAVIVSKDVHERAKEATELVVALETRRLRVALDKLPDARRSDTYNAFAAIYVALRNLDMAEIELNLVYQQPVMDRLATNVDMDMDDIANQVNRTLPRMRSMSLHEGIADDVTPDSYRGSDDVATSELEELRADFHAQLGLSEDQQARMTEILTGNASHPLSHTGAAGQDVNANLIRAACAQKAMRVLSRLFENGGQSRHQQDNNSISQGVSSLADKFLLSCLKPKQISKLLTKTAENLVDGRLPDRTTRDDEKVGVGANNRVVPSQLQDAIGLKKASVPLERATTMELLIDSTMDA